MPKKPWKSTSEWWFFSLSECSRESPMRTPLSPMPLWVPSPWVWTWFNSLLIKRIVQICRHLTSGCACLGCFLSTEWCPTHQIIWISVTQNMIIFPFRPCEEEIEAQWIHCGGSKFSLTGVLIRRIYWGTKYIDSRKTTRGHHEKQTSASQAKWPWKKLSLLVPWFWASILYSYEKIEYIISQS